MRRALLALVLIATGYCAGLATPAAASNGGYDSIFAELRAIRGDLKEIKQALGRRY